MVTADVWQTPLVSLILPLHHYGKEYTYKIYEQEPHGWYHWRPEDVEESMRRAGEFIDRKMLGMRGSYGK